MAGHDIIVIGASAGGIQALADLFELMPQDLAASFFVVVHTGPSSAGLLPRIIGRRSRYAAEYAIEGEPIQRERIYVAPPDHHLLLKPDRLCVVRGPKENGFRPAVDPLFRTAANAYGPRVIGVILSGGLDDGTAGLMRIKEQGGIAVVQDPIDAPFPSMPASAIQNVAVDHVVGISEMSELLPQLIEQPVPQELERMSRTSEPDIAELGSDALRTGELPYPPSGFTCPECGGALWELKDGKLLRFRCHVGHGYTAESLQAEQSNGLEAALWTALRALEENAALRRRMAERAGRGRVKDIADRYLKQAEEAEARAAVVRKALVSEPGDARKMKGSHPKRGNGAAKGRQGRAQTRAAGLGKGQLTG
jgi:two-component system chemotaxis response regulator CheB